MEQIQSITDKPVYLQQTHRVMSSHDWYIFPENKKIQFPYLIQRSKLKMTIKHWAPYSILIAYYIH